MGGARPTSVDLFCGAGGMTLGFEQAGFDVLAAFDLEEFNIRTHRMNFPNTVAVVADLSKETGVSLRERARLGNQEVDVVFGGPPCQGFSLGGRKDLDDERNRLVYDFARLVRQLRPRYFVMENVKGFLSPHSRPVLRSFVRRIKLAGYEIVEPIRALNAAEYGVPQRRWRTFVLGYRKGEYPPSYPDPSDSVDVDGEPYKPLVRDAIGDLWVIDEFKELLDTDCFNGELPPAESDYARIMRGYLRSAHDLSLPRYWPSDGLTGCLRTRHSKKTAQRFAATAPGGAEPISRYIRLRWDDVSPTIRAGTGSDRGSHTAPRPIHPSSPRCITAREAARLHSIPDWFRLHGTRWHDFRQIGNAVPPFLARAVARSVFSALNE